MIEIRWN